jgi:hypothetical protein
MTLSTVGTSALPPTPNGVKEFLSFTAVAVGVYVFGVPVLAIIFQVTP